MYFLSLAHTLAVLIDCLADCLLPGVFKFPAITLPVYSQSIMDFSESKRDKGSAVVVSGKIKWNSILKVN